MEWSVDFHAHCEKKLSKKKNLSKNRWIVCVWEGREENYIRKVKDTEESEREREEIASQTWVRWAAIIACAALRIEKGIIER